MLSLSKHGGWRLAGAVAVAEGWGKRRGITLSLSKGGRRENGIKNGKVTTTFPFSLSGPPGRFCIFNILRLQLDKLLCELPVALGHPEEIGSGVETVGVEFELALDMAGRFHQRTIQ